MQITSQVLLDFCRREEVKREKCTMVAKQGSRLRKLLFAEEGEETDTDAESIRSLSSQLSHPSFSQEPSSP